MSEGEPYMGGYSILEVMEIINERDQLRELVEVCEGALQKIYDECDDPPGWERAKRALDRIARYREGE